MVHAFSDSLNHHLQHRWRRVQLWRVFYKLPKRLAVWNEKKKNCVALIFVVGFIYQSCLQPF